MTRRARDTVPDPLLRRAARDADGRGTPTDECIGPDMAAAWADNTLTSAERSVVMAHAAECSRCRSLLAALVQTAPPAAAARAPWWKAPVVRWAAPLGAVTGALILWVAVERRPVDSLDGPASRPAAPAAAGQEARQGASAGAVATAPSEAAPRRDTTAPGRAAPQAPAAPKTPPAAAANEDRRAVDALERQRAGKRAEAPPAAATESLTVLSGRAVSSFAAALEVVAPDGSIRWRVTQPGSVERSNDGGATWEPQALDTKVPLAAGASPAPETCWLVGGGGTVLRTTDGRTWRRVSVPDPADLVAVAAKDADVATVTTADGRTFRTTDGGVTWSR